MEHLMAKKNKNNKDSQKGQVTPKNILKKRIVAYKNKEIKPLIFFLFFGFVQTA